MTTTLKRSQRFRTRKTPIFVNEAQRLLLSRYKDGMYSHIALARTKSHFEVELQRCGDPVLEALLGLLSDQQGCVGLEHAKPRVATLLSCLVSLNTDLYQNPCRP